MGYDDYCDLWGDSNLICKFIVVNNGEENYAMNMGRLNAYRVADPRSNFSIYLNQAMEILDQSSLDDYDDDRREEAKEDIVVDEDRGRRTDA
ncbi:hypothetical protein LTR97_012586 [Elasticomyces elasticus]|uniref:Uncharacterized protein n=1 Tax=Elasticomyces elasticus TaxID=574655 RepID=A0AAN7VKQ9_9PEZI|nr:hypothetical protein LTR97_012586 [Elasticomyces elasticus]